MDDDDKFDFGGAPEFIPTGHPLVDIGDGLIRLAREVENNSVQEVRDILTQYMLKLYASVRVPMGELHSINEDDEVAGNA